MKRTSAQVKNVMWRGLQCLVDPEPNKTQRNAAFAYFNYKCAYCPETITLEIGDLDHLVPVSQHGHGWNHISNRVPPCKGCNAKHKREKHWLVYLEQKCVGNANLLAQKRHMIEQWIQTCGAMPILADHILGTLKAEHQHLVSEYDAACNRLRAPAAPRLDSNGSSAIQSP